MKDHLKTQNCSKMGRADSHRPPQPYYIPGHHAKHLKRIIAAHYTFKYVKYTMALQSSQQLPGWYSLPQYWGTIFKHRNSTSELLLLCRFSHKSQFSPPAPPPRPPQPCPHPPQGAADDLGGGAFCSRWAAPPGRGKSEARPSCSRRQ